MKKFALWVAVLAFVAGLLVERSADPKAGWVRSASADQPKPDNPPVPPPPPEDPLIPTPPEDRSEGAFRAVAAPVDLLALPADRCLRYVREYSDRSQGVIEGWVPVSEFRRDAQNHLYLRDAASLFRNRAGTFPMVRMHFEKGYWYYDLTDLSSVYEFPLGMPMPRDRWGGEVLIRPIRYKEELQKFDTPR